MWHEQEKERERERRGGEREREYALTVVYAKGFRQRGNHR